MKTIRVLWKVWKSIIHIIKALVIGILIAGVIRHLNIIDGNYFLTIFLCLFTLIFIFSLSAILIGYIANNENEYFTFFEKEKYTKN
jgi:predicted tellurium resistance membrane protein TerC